MRTSKTIMSWRRMLCVRKPFGRHVLALRVIWRPAVVTAVHERTVDVVMQGWEANNGLPRAQVLARCESGAGALLLAAVAEGCEALLENGASAFVAEERANTPLHRAAAAGHVGVCRALIARGVDSSIVNSGTRSARGLGRERRLAAERARLERLKRAREEADEERRAKRARERELAAAMEVEEDTGRVTPALILARNEHYWAALRRRASGRTPRDGSCATWYAESASVWRLVLGRDGLGYWSAGRGACLLERT